MITRIVEDDDIYPHYYCRQVGYCLFWPHTCARAFNGLLSGTTRVGRYHNVTNLDLLKQETVSGSGISWAVCKSAPHSRQITTPALHYSVFYRPDALPATQPTASKHWRHDNPAHNQKVINKSLHWDLKLKLTDQGQHQTAAGVLKCTTALLCLHCKVLTSCSAFLSKDFSTLRCFSMFCDPSCTADSMRMWCRISSMRSINRFSLCFAAENTHTPV